MGNVVQSECSEENPMCSCLNPNDRGSTTSEVAFSQDRIAYNSSNPSASRKNVKKSSSKKKPADQRSKEKGEVVPAATSGDGTDTKMNQSDAIEENRNTKVFAGKEVENMDVESDSGKGFQAETKQVEPKATQQAEATRTPSDPSMVSNLRESGHESSVDISDILTILGEPQAFQRQILSQLFHKWDSERSGLSLDQLSDARSFLLQNTATTSDEHIDDLMFQSLDQESAVLRETAFIDIIEKTNIDLNHVHSLFLSLGNLEIEADEKMISANDAKNALKEIGKSSYNGNWLDDNMWNFILDQMVQETELVSSERFTAQNEILAILLRCLNIQRSDKL